VKKRRSRQINHSASELTSSPLISELVAASPSCLSFESYPSSFQQRDMTGDKTSPPSTVKVKLAASSHVPVIKSPLSNGTSSAAPTIRETRSPSHGSSQIPTLLPPGTAAMLSRTSVAKSEGLLRPISDTPPTAPTSPRLGPYVPSPYFLYLLC
jgi:hypothetical protein